VNTKRKRPLRVLLLAVAVIILYFLLFPYPAGRELVARPAWAVPLPGLLPSPGAPDAAAASAAPFQLGGVFGYVDGEGRLLTAGAVPFRVALSGRGFVAYSRLGTTWIFQDPRGGRQFSFSGDGYPLLSPDGARLFTVKTDLSGLTEIALGGDTLWTRDFPSLVTSLSVQGDLLAAGLLSGEVDLVDRQGKLAFPAVPGESRIPIILGCALSPDASLLAAVSGIDPQALTVWRRDGAAWRVASRSTLSSDFRREVRMAFDPAGDSLSFEGEDGIRFWDPASRRTVAVPLSGGLSASAFLRKPGAAVFVGGGEARRELLVVMPVGSPRIREVFSARSVSVGTVEDGLLLGVDGLLLRIDVESM
jgi:hypothetical protein